MGKTFDKQEAIANRITADGLEKLLAEMDGHCLDTDRERKNVAEWLAPHVRFRRGKVKP